MDDDYIEEASEALVENLQLGDEEAEDHSGGAQEEACMSTGQGEDSMENLEHEAHLLALETQSSEERKDMHVEVDRETIAPPSYAFHYLERWRQHRELDDKLQA